MRMSLRLLSLGFGLSVTLESSDYDGVEVVLYKYDGTNVGSQKIKRGTFVPPEWVTTIVFPRPDIPAKCHVSWNGKNFEEKTLTPGNCPQGGYGCVWDGIYK